MRTPNPQQRKGPTVGKFLSNQMTESAPKTAARSSVGDAVTKVPEKLVPRVSTSEQIFIFLDRSKEANDMEMKLTDGTDLNVFERIKKAVRLLVANKHHIRPPYIKHEYSLIINYGDDPVMLELRTHSEFLETLQEISVEEQDSGTLDLGAVVNLVASAPSVNLNQTQDLPDSVVRLILFVTRSMSVPSFGAEFISEAAAKLLAYPLFFLDVVYLHHPPSPDNRVKEVQGVLSQLNTPRSLLLDVSPNPTELHNSVASLLISPILRRPEDIRRKRIRDEH